MIKTCQSCGGAIFTGSGVVDWGGPICGGCPQPKVADFSYPRMPTMEESQMAILNELKNILTRIEGKLDNKKVDK